MKGNAQRFIALLLAGLMTCSATACSTGEDIPAETKNTAITEAVSEDDTGFKPDIDVTDYDCEFVITGAEPIKSWSVAAEDSAGDPFMDAIYERGIRIKDHLGVDLVLADSGGEYDYDNVIIRTVQAGDDAYQLVTTACHLGVNTLISSGAMYDFSDLESINLDAPYWALDLMEEYVINDEYLIGYNDLCLANAACIVFCKDLADEYMLKYPYEDVSNMKWTMDRMLSLASNVARDNGDSVWDEKDTYGIVGVGFSDLVPFTTSNGLKMADKDEDGIYHVAYNDNPERMLTMLEKVSAMRHAEYAYFWVPFTERMDKVVPFEEGKALMMLTTTTGFTGLRGAAIRFGVLPYPMFDEAQGEYLSLSWNGLLMIPSSIKQPDMVSDVIEMLAYYTAPVKTAFYEDLLGSKLAEAPEDAEMLNIIWASQSNDICLITAEDGNRVWVDLLYMVPTLCTDGIEQYSSFLKARTKGANKIIDALFNPRR